MGTILVISQNPLARPIENAAILAIKRKPFRLYLVHAPDLFGR
jgi:hypothetical protein